MGTTMETGVTGRESGAVSSGPLWTGWVIAGLMGAFMWLLAPVFSHTLFLVYFGMLTWLALWLRGPRLGELIPLRKAL